MSEYLVPTDGGAERCRPISRNRSYVGTRSMSPSAFSFLSWYGPKSGVKHTKARMGGHSAHAGMVCCCSRGGTLSACAVGMLVSTDGVSVGRGSLLRGALPRPP